MDMNGKTRIPNQQVGVSYFPRCGSAPIEGYLQNPVANLSSNAIKSAQEAISGREKVRIRIVNAVGSDKNFKIARSEEDLREQLAEYNATQLRADATLALKEYSDTRKRGAAKHAQNFQKFIKVLCRLRRRLLGHCVTC